MLRNTIKKQRVTVENSKDVCEKIKNKMKAERIKAEYEKREAAKKRLNAEERKIENERRNNEVKYYVEYFTEIELAKAMAKNIALKGRYNYIKKDTKYPRYLVYCKCTKKEFDKAHKEVFEQYPKYSY